MNLPFSARVWLALKCWIADLSSGFRAGSDNGLSSVSQNFLSKSSPVAQEIWQAVISDTGEQDSVEPAKTHPKWVSKAMGVPVGPIRRPCRIASTKMSIPSSMSNFPGQPNPGSARSMPSRWFHSFFNGMGANGRSQVTLGTIIAVTSNFLWGDLTGEMLKLAANWCEVWYCMPATPDILALWLVLGNRRVWARRSDTNDAEDPLSSKALASTRVPSGAHTKTRQVISKVFDLSRTAALVITSLGSSLWGTLNNSTPLGTKGGATGLMAKGGVAGLELAGTFWRIAAGLELMGIVEGGSATRLELIGTLSTCNRVWCGFWHRLHRCTDLHCFTKWLDEKQFIHRLFDFRVAILHSCDISLNLGHAYNGCLSVLHRIHWLEYGSVFAVWEATLPLGAKLLLEGVSCFGFLGIPSVIEDSDAWARRFKKSRSSW